LMFDERLLSLV